MLFPARPMLATVMKTPVCTISTRISGIISDRVDRATIRKITTAVRIVMNRYSPQKERDISRFMAELPIRYVFPLKVSSHAAESRSINRKVFSSSSGYRVVTISREWFSPTSCAFPSVSCCLPSESAAFASSPSSGANRGSFCTVP